MLDSHALRHAAKRRAFAISAIALAAVAVAPEAGAQGFYVGGGFYRDEPPPLISPRAVAYRLQDRGFSEISRPRFDGRAYIVDATNPVGARVRLFVDAHDGVVVGRQRLDAPYFPSARPVRPGYGWTEEDVAPRRTARAYDGPIPPGHIPEPVPTPRPPANLGNPSPDAPARAGSIDPNPSGINPDAKGRPAPAPRKSARLNQPQKPATAKLTPAAPAPKLEAADTAKSVAVPETKPETATVEPPKLEPATTATIPTADPAPAAASPAEAPASANAERPAAGTPATEPSKAEAQPPEAPKPAAEAAKPEPAKTEQAWQDPPERKVRVINGATVVPGSGESQPATTN